MHKVFATVPRYVDKQDIEEALLRADNFSLDMKYMFAIVDNLKDSYYLGSVTWEELHVMLRNDKFGTGKLDLFQISNIDLRMLRLNFATSMNDALNFFDLHKQKAFFVVKEGKVRGKLYLKDIVELCNTGQL